MVRNIVITATACAIPERTIPNSQFLDETKYQFFKEDGTRDPRENKAIVSKLAEITSITERRHMNGWENSSDLGAKAARNLSEEHSYNLESLDRIIVAHNFGDVDEGDSRIDIVSSMAEKIAYKAGIKNPRLKTEDIIFGCPGWLAAVAKASEYIRSGSAERIAVVASEGLSRVCDPHDANSMIFSDGAGIAILEAREGEEKEGMISYAERSDAECAGFLTMGSSFNPDYHDRGRQFIKMKGPDVFKYAVQRVPGIVKESLEKANVRLSDIKTILLHQANERLDYAILEKLGLSQDQIKTIAPMTIGRLGNSSVATLPTLLDLVLKKKMMGYNINPGDLIAFVSVGSPPAIRKSMNCNSAIYRWPKRIARAA